MFPAWRLHTQLAEEVAGFPAADVADECDSPVAVGDNDRTSSTNPRNGFLCRKRNWLLQTRPVVHQKK